MVRTVFVMLARFSDVYTCNLLAGVSLRQHDADILMQWEFEYIDLWNSMVLLSSWMFCLKIDRERTSILSGLSLHVTNATLFFH